MCNFILLYGLQRKKKVSSLGEVLCGEWMRQHNLATWPIWRLQLSQPRALLIYGQNFLWILLVDRWSVFSYVAQFSSLQQTGTELFILSHKRAEWYVRYLIRYWGKVLLFLYLCYYCRIHYAQQKANVSISSNLFLNLLAAHCAKLYSRSGLVN